MNMHDAASARPFGTAKLEFLTVTNGHTMTMSRADTTDDVIERLRPIVLAGRGHILGWDIQMVRGEAGGAAGFTLRRGRDFLTSSYVAWTEEGSVEFWPVIQQVARSGFGVAVAAPPNTLPWLAAVVMPCAPEASRFLSEAASLELCLAWAILEAVPEFENPSEETREAIAECHARASMRNLGIDPDNVDPVTAEAHARARRMASDGWDTEVTGRALPEEGARLSIGPDGLVILVRLVNPTAAEVADIRRGKLDIGVLSVGGTGILLTRFGAAADTPRHPPQEPIVLDCPYHIGMLPPDQRRLPEREAGMSRALTIVIEDQHGKQFGGRHLALSLPTAEAIERIVARQAGEAGRPGWTSATHDAEVRRFYDRNPDIGRAAKRLFAKGWASETVQ